MGRSRVSCAIAILAFCLGLIAISTPVQAQIMPMDQWLKMTEHQGTIPPGTVITNQNWEKYKDFMPPGMIELFKGDYFWKMPPGVQMHVDATKIIQPSKFYMAATEKYASQVRIVHLPDGGNTIANYVGGRPFPNPSGPDAGFEVMTNLWYTYAPHLIVSIPSQPVSFCTEDRFQHLACTLTPIDYRALAYNTDPGIPRTNPQAGPMQYTEWLMVVKPEQSKYTADLTIFYQDMTREEDDYVFIPSLRRTLRLSVSARCAPLFGSDMTHDDQRAGFNIRPPRINAKLLGVRKILAQTRLTRATGKFPENYMMPLGWAKPSWGPWELRKVYVVDVRMIPSQAAGYCYGKRIIYVDATFFHGLWEELYDSGMKLWKIVSIKSASVGPENAVPGIGIVGFNGDIIEQYWDVQNDHASHVFTATPDGHDLLFNSDAPPEWNNVQRFSTPGGLMHIMR